MILKTIGKRVLQILLFLLILLVLLSLTLFIHHQITKEKVEDYLPQKAQAYIEIESFKDFYNDIIDLKALEIVFSQEKLNDFLYSIIDFKNNDYSKSWLFQEALNLRTYIILQDDFSPSLIIDPGLKGIATRHIPLFLKYITNDKIGITKIEKEERDIYKISLIGEKDYYLLIEKNLILFALNKEHIHRMIHAKDSGQGIATRNRLKEIKTVKVKDNILNLFVESDSFFKDNMAKGTSLQRLFSMVDFPSLASISLALSNENINIKASAQIETNNELLSQFLGFRARSLGVISTLPDTTNLYTSVNFKSFKDLYGIFNLLQDDLVIEDYDNLLKLLSGLNSDDILFSWTSSEAGLFTIETAPEPVIFIEISNDKKLDNVLESLDSSLVLNISDSLIIDDIRIHQLKYPEIIKAGMSLARKATELPYFIRYNDYMFLSMNPEVLAQIVLKDRNGDLLLKEDTYKDITAKIPKNANFFFYYDLNSTLPRFVGRKSLLSQLLKEYEKGVVSLYYSKDKITLNLSAESSRSNRTTLYPGYPKKTGSITSQVYIEDVTGGDSKELIYITKDKKLKINDVSNNLLSEMQLDGETEVTLLRNKEILLNDRDGGLYKLNGQADMIEPFPQFSSAKDSFAPLLTDRGFILYSSVEEQIQHFDNSGALIGSIDVSKKVLSAPLFMDKRIYYYPKSLMGSIYCTDLEGNPMEGWPQNAKGISFSSPFRANNKIGFLTQKGDFYLWNYKGEVQNGFPVKLEGVYYSTPLVLDHKNLKIATISDDGLLSLIDGKGEVTSSRQIDSIGGKDLKLTSYYSNELKSNIIFTYGASNYILAINENLKILPGFPVNGYSKPSFSDLNNDGITEFVSAGYDKKLYIYTLRTEP